MNLDNAILVRTFLKMPEADLAAAQLRSAGIECSIRSDDAGGMYPALEPIQLLVNPDSADNARRIRFDTDDNGAVDGTISFKDGVLAQIDWQPNRTNAIILRQRFQHGVLTEESRDTDGDGAFDMSVRFGPFLNPLQTNLLAAPNPAR